MVANAVILPQDCATQGAAGQAGQRMRQFLWVLAVVAGSAQAEDASLTSLQTGEEARGWEAVGRLDIDGKGFCTGALIAPDLVLTAAHCMFDRESGLAIDPARMQFLAGLRNGRALAYRDVRLALTLPDYVHTGVVSALTSRYDLALLQLTQPIRSTEITPFAVTPSASIGTEVAVVSYAADRAEAPSLQQVCGVLGQQDGVIVMSCDVDFGSSGAPIFSIRDGVARIVSVVSAKADLDGDQVALGTNLDAPLAALYAELDTDRGQFLEPLPAQVRVITPGQRNDTGAKFVSVETD
jgi:protease YdgD